MNQTPKQLADSLHQNLNDLEAPHNIRERSAVLSKILDIPKQLALGLLEGTLVPDVGLLQRIESEFEIEVEGFLKK